MTAYFSASTTEEFSAILTESERLAQILEGEPTSVTLVAGQAIVRSSADEPTQGFFDLRIQLPADTTLDLSGYSLAVEISPDSGIQLTTASQSPGALFPNTPVYVFGTGSRLEVSQFLANIGESSSVQNNDRLFRVEFSVEPGVEVTLPLTLADVVLADKDGNVVSGVELHPGQITTRMTGPPIGSEFILVPQNQTGNIGDIMSTIPTLTRFHEWQTIGGELWLQVDDNLPDDIFDLTINLTSSAEYYVAPQLLENLGTVLEFTTSSDANIITTTFTLGGLDMSGYLSGDRVLVATLVIEPDIDNNVGIPSDGISGYVTPITQHAFSLPQVEVVDWPVTMLVIHDVNSVLLPVIYDSSEDGRVGIADFADFIRAYGKSTETHVSAFQFDYDRDGRIGLRDFALFIRHYGIRKPTNRELNMPGLTTEISASSAVESVLIEGEQVLLPIREEPLPAAKDYIPTVDPILTSLSLSSPSQGKTQFPEPRKKALQLEWTLRDSENLLIQFGLGTEIVMEYLSSSDYLIDVLLEDGHWDFDIAEFDLDLGFLKIQTGLS